MMDKINELSAKAIKMEREGFPLVAEMLWRESKNLLNEMLGSLGDHHENN